MGRKTQPYRRTLAHCAVDLEFGAVALDHAIYHGQPESRAALPLGRIKRFEAAAACVLVHADSGVGHFDQDPLGGLTVRRRAGAHRQRAAGRHGVDGIENQVGERIANLVFRSHDVGRDSDRSAFRSTITPRCCGRSLHRGW